MACIEHGQVILVIKLGKLTNVLKDGFIDPFIFVTFSIEFAHFYPFCPTVGGPGGQVNKRERELEGK